MDFFFNFFGNNSENLHKRARVSQDRMLELSEVMNGALESFDETYGTQVPVGDTDETRFVLSVIGLVANLAAVDAGRRFFSQTDSGKNVVGRVMSVAPRVPSPAGNQLKK